MIRFMAVCLMLLVSAVAVAAAPASQSVVDPAQSVGFIISMFQDSRWWPAFSGLALLLTWVFEKILKGKLPKKSLPWVSLGLAAAVQFTGMMMGGSVWWQALVASVMTGLAGSGMWSAGQGPKNLLQGKTLDGGAK